MPEEVEQPSSFYEAEADEQSNDFAWPAFFIQDAEVSSEQDEVTVGVFIANNPGIAGALLRFYYDDRLTLIDAQLGVAFSSLDYTAPGEFESPCNFSWDSESAQAEEDGAVLSLKFKLPKETQPGNVYEIRCSFRDGDVYNSDLNNVTIGTNTGKIIIK